MCRGGVRRAAAKVATAVARVTLECAMRVVVVVVTATPARGRGLLSAASDPRTRVDPTPRGGAVSRRLSLAGQLLALQVVIICVVLVGVAAVTVAQSTQRASDYESSRAQAVAESLAGSRAVRATPGRADRAAVRGVRSATSARPPRARRTDSGAAVGGHRDGRRHGARQRRPVRTGRGRSTWVRAPCSTAGAGPVSATGRPARSRSRWRRSCPTPAASLGLRRGAASPAVDPRRAPRGRAQPADLPRASRA